MDYGPTPVDLVTLAVGAAGYMLGHGKGLAWQVSGLLTLLGGGACATVLSRPLAPVFSTGVAGRFVAWIVVYAVVAVCLYLLTLRFRHRLKEMELDELDRRFGGMLGAAKALAVFALLALVAVPLSPPIARVVKPSLTGLALRGVVHELRGLLPEKIHEGFGPWLDAVDPAPAGTPAQAATPPSRPAPPPAPPPPPVRPTPPSAPATSPPTPPIAPPATPPAAPSRATPDPPTLPVRPLFPDEEPAPEPDTAEHELEDPFDPSRVPPDPLAPPRAVTPR